MNYVIIEKQSKQIFDIYTKKPISVSNSLEIAECENIPIYDKNSQYLTAANIQEHTRIIKEAYTEVVEDYDDNGEKIGERKIQHKAVKENYLTCDLVVNNIEFTAEQKQVKYEMLVEKYIREKYSPNDENKVVREYLADMTNVEKKAQFDDYNAYVESCKTRAKNEIYN